MRFFRIYPVYGKPCMNNDVISQNHISNEHKRGRTCYTANLDCGHITIDFRYFCRYGKTH